MKFEACSRHLMTTFATILDPQRQGAAIEIGVGTQDYYFVDFAQVGFPTLAVEPAPAEEVLRTCRELNVPLEQAAIAEEEGEVTLYLGEYKGQLNVNLNSLNPDWWGVANPTNSPGSPDANSRGTLQVPALTLKTLLKKRSIERLSILKVDTEGSEFGIINGLREIPPESLPILVQFEYGGGGDCQSQEGGWNLKYFKSTLDCLKVLKDLGYEWLLLIDRDLPVPYSFYIQEITNFEDIFHPLSHVGNAIACKTLPITSEVNLHSLCYPYLNYSRKLAQSLVDLGSSERVDSFKYILPYLIVEQYKIKRRPLRVLEYGSGCNTEQFIGSLVCHQLVSVEDNPERYKKITPLIKSAGSKIDIDYRLIELKNKKSTFYLEKNVFTESEISAYCEYPLKYGEGHFDIIFIHVGDRLHELTATSETNPGFLVSNLCLKLSHTLLAENGVVLVHGIPSLFSQIHPALESGIKRFSSIKSFPEFYTTVLSNSLNLNEFEHYINNLYGTTRSPKTVKNAATSSPQFIDKIDELLSEFDVEGVATVTPYHPSGGDALYVKKPVITLSTLGTNGRFANQLFQYAFLKIYAQQHDLQVETPEWIGQYLFGHCDRPLSKNLPEIKDITTLCDDSPILQRKTPLKNVDIWGYFQFHTRYYSQYKEEFCSLFQPVAEVKQQLQPVCDRLQSQGKTTVGLHIRLKDYGFSYFFIAPLIWYKTWLAQIWDTLDQPVLFIASDEPEKVLPHFSEYQPVTAKSLGAELLQAEFYPDFYLLSHCDILAISNSTFSFVASMLNKRGKGFWRPQLSSQTLIPYDPWNSEPILHEAKVPKKYEPACLRTLRQQITDRWLGLPRDRLKVTYFSGVGIDAKIMVARGVKNEPLTPSEEQFVQELNPRINPQLDTPSALQALLIAMMYRDAYQLPLLYNRAAIPKWFFPDFWKFLCAAPSAFSKSGEPEQYWHYVQELTNYLHFHLFQNPRSDLWRYIALCFTQFHNFKALSSWEGNPLEIAQKRGDILEFTLKNLGQPIDYECLPRPSTRSKIRLGILQQNFFGAKETVVTLAAFEHLDREKFEIRLYAIARQETDLQHICQNSADSLVQLPEKLAAQVKKIRADHLDILLIGSEIGSTTNAIALLACHRLARVQCTGAWVSPTTTGLRHLDYYIAGTLMTGPTFEDHYRERVVTVEGSGLCFARPQIREGHRNQPTRHRWGATEETVIFISGATTNKITPQIRETWAKILAAVPNSKLVLYPFGAMGAKFYCTSPYDNHSQRVLEQYGIDQSRLVVIDQLKSLEELKNYLRQADLYLDAYPDTGDLSLLDPLEVGLPIIVREGKAPQTRRSPALLRELQLSEFITHSEAAYIQLAISLANNPRQREQYRQQLQHCFQNKSPCLDTRAYSAKIGALLEKLVKNPI